MKRFMKFLILLLAVVPLTINAETIQWTGPTTYTDGSTIDAATKAALGYYLRGYKEGNTAAKTYFGETRNGVATWTDNVLVRMNIWAATNSVPGWVVLKVGDNVLVTLSTTYKDSTGKEIEGPESPTYRWTLPGYAAPPPPPKPSPSCNPPTGITIKP